MGVSAPRSANGALSAGISRFERRTVSLLLEGASEASGALHGGRVIYENALPSTDRVVASDASAVEDLFLLKHESTFFELSYRIDLGEDMTRAAQRGNEIDFWDIDDHVAMRMRAPYAIDAAGVTRAASVVLTPETRTLRISVDTRGLAFPVVLDPTVELGGWAEIPLAEAALARSGTAIAYDATRREVILFGGRTGSGTLTYFGDTWRWSGGSWVQAFPAHAPSARADHAMAYDSVRGEIIAFGGKTATADLRRDTQRHCRVRRQKLREHLLWRLHALGRDPMGRVRGQRAALASGKCVRVGRRAWRNALVRRSGR